MSNLSWLGIGVLAGILFVSLVHGSLEKFRGNSPADVRLKNEKIQTLDAQTSTLKTRVEDLETIEKQLKIDLAIAKLRVDELETGNVGAQRQVKELNDGLVELNDTIRKSLEKIEALERERDELENKNQNLQNQYIALDQELIGSRRQVTQLEERERELARTVGNLEDSLAETHRNASHMETERREAVLQVNARDQQIQVLQRRVRELEVKDEESIRRINHLWGSGSNS
jgi:chromosome segregation ATPase